MIDDNIIEAEVVESTLDEPVQSKDKPMHVKSDKRNQILFWGNLASYCFRYGFPVSLVCGFAGLAFSILYSESHSTLNLVLLIIAFSICGTGVLASIFGIVARALMIHYMKQDPNFENQVK